MHALRLTLLGVLGSGFFALGGYDYGVAILLGALPAGGPQRRMALHPGRWSLFGSELWLALATGLLLIGFPTAEAKLLTALRPLLVAVLIGAAVLTMALPLRNRARRTGCWDALIIGCGALLCAAWGLIVGTLALDGHPDFDPSALLWSGALMTLFAAQGTAFLARQGPDWADWTARLTPRLCLTAAWLVISAVLLGLTIGLREPGWTVSLATILVLLLLGACRTRGAVRAALLSAAAVLPVLLAGVASKTELSPVDPVAPAPLNPLLFAIVALPALGAVHWWVSRSRPGDQPRHPQVPMAAATHSSGRIGGRNYLAKDIKGHEGRRNSCRRC